MLIGNAVVGQSGGPTAAINATLSGVVAGAKSSPAIETVYGMQNGIEGFLQEKLIRLTDILKTDKDHFLLECTPAAALGSCRKKLPQNYTDETYQQILSILQKYNIRYFFYIGGNDSMDTVHKLSEYIKTTGYEIRIMGIPKTIDNDLIGTDHTPGFGSAAKFVATSIQEIVRDCAVYTVKAVTIVEIMGRDAGWLTAAAGLPRLTGGGAADLIYLPEVIFDYDDFIESVEKELQKKPNVVIAVSEGIQDKNGKYVGEATQSGSKDVFGHKYLAGTAKRLEHLLKEKLNCKVRSIELSLPQRCASHLLSKCDIDESRQIGFTSVTSAVQGMTASVTVIKRICDGEYKTQVTCMPVNDIANKIKKVPNHMILGNNITDELLRYIYPLILGQINIPYKDGLPEHFVIHE